MNNMDALTLTYLGLLFYLLGAYIIFCWYTLQKRKLEKTGCRFRWWE
jgi:hypothetical protein